MGRAQHSGLVLDLASGHRTVNAVSHVTALRPHAAGLHLPAQTWTLSCVHRAEMPDR